MSKMIYNGTMLPDIRTVYTDEIKAEYPHAVIIFYESENVYRLCVSSEPGYVYYFLKERIQMGDTYGKVDMDAGFSEWGELTFYTSETNAAVNGEATWFIWSNHDIYYPDDYSHDATLAGTLYLSASDPIPVGTITDPVSFMMGYQIGCRLRAQRGKKEPVAYLYNGVRLPALPEWDKSNYPYAWIHQFNTASPSYVLRIASEPIVYKKPILKDYYVYSMTGTGCIYNINDGVWEIFQSDVAFDNYFPESNVLFSWTNTDIINQSDGTVYLAASEPVPVYE